MENFSETKDKTKKKHFVNFRPLFYGFLAFAIGIAFSYYIFSLDITYIVLFSVLALLVIGFAVFRKTFVNLLIVVSCFALGVGCYFLDAKNFTSNLTYGNEYMVEGRATTHIYDKEETIFVILDNVSLDGNKTDNLALSIYKIDGFSIETGQRIKFSAKVYDEFLFENGQFNSYAYKMNATHNAFVNSNEVQIVSDGNLSFAETVRLHVKSLLHSFMPFETAELSYSILFGDQTQLDEDIKQNFSTSGLGHLVAVSGLNIAVLVACLYWLLRIFKTTKLFRFIFVSIVLLFYCYLCSFAPSVVRASIMAIVFLASTLLGRQYDILSSLGMAGFIILILNPFSVFDAGFLMSFVSVIAIGILVPPITKFFNQKCKIPNGLANALAIDISTTLAISPILAMYFGKISFFSWLTNLICVPIFSFAYILVFALVFVLSAFKFLGFLLFIPNILMQFIIWFSGVIASLDFAIINLYSLSLIGCVGFFLCLFFFSKLFMGDKLQRLSASALSVMVAVIMVFAVDRPNIPLTATYTQINTYSPSAVITSQNGEVLVVGYNADVEAYLRYNRIETITAYVATSMSPKTTLDFTSKYSAKTISYSSPEFKTVGDFSFKHLYQNELLKAVYVEVENVGIVIALNHIGAKQAESIRFELAQYNPKVLFEARESKNFLSTGAYGYVVSNDKIDGIQNNFATKISGTFTFSISNGIIKEVRSEN